MIYVEFNEYRNKYYETQRKYNEIISEKEMLFSLTQPKAVVLDEEKVMGGKPKSKYDEYLCKLEEKRINERLEEIRSILTDRKHLLQMKEAELRESENIHDKIYCCKYLDKMKIYQIKRKVGYEDAQIYRILRQIKRNIK